MNKILRIIIWPILLAPMIWLAVSWNSFPEKIAIHFDQNGVPDKFDNKNTVPIYIGIIVILAIAIYILLPLSYKIDRKKGASENKPRLQRIAFAIAVFMSFMACLLIYSINEGEGIQFNLKLILGVIGLLWCIMGNYMYNIKPNHFAGFRTRWTLNNEENWRKTHQLGGKVWFIGGLLVAIASFFTTGYIPLIVFIIITFFMILVPSVYSYRMHKKQSSEPVNS